MRTMHMELRMKQRAINNEAIALVEKYGEFNMRGDQIVLSRKMIRRLLRGR